MRHFGRYSRTATLASSEASRLKYLFVVGHCIAEGSSSLWLGICLVFELVYPGIVVGESGGAAGFMKVPDFGRHFDVVDRHGFNKAVELVPGDTDQTEDIGVLSVERAERPNTGIGSPS